MNKLKNLTVLVVDDHPFTSDAYINLISKEKDENSFKFVKETNCETAFNSIQFMLKKGKKLDMALLDINLPPYEKGRILSGSDLAVLIREKFPKCKIIMLTMHTEPLLLNKVIKTINPEGFISKNDIDFTTFPNIFFKIKNGENYFSPTINKSIQALVGKTLNWDEYDTQIILLLEKGIQTKDIPNYIDISLSSVEKRKASIKRQLAEQKITDNELITLCKKLKLI
ncbi:response regulator [Flavobacterium difficile]|uniref:Response regulator transcription factor n=1 Tax=Flavobacterium difficile TaxID=2709659 RepID=A0ABX0I2S5_9FLAO|nr:response regulator [Flavobacterium difficile]NHM01479.1 response regulator transcription factor [Flavobacterium difficile]